MTHIGRRARLPWTTVVPIVSLIALAATWGTKPAGAVLVIAGVFLALSVPAAVHHAEVIAHRVGEPFGSLVLAVAVTVIEVGLIVTLMVTSDSDTSALARDTVFAAVMLTCNAILGLSLLAVTARGGVASFNAEGTATAFGSVLTLATLSLVVPNFTTSRPGPEFSSEQLTFAAIVSLALYLLFVFVQTVRNREHFVDAEPPDGEPPVTNRARTGAEGPSDAGVGSEEPAGAEAPPAHPPLRDALVSLVLLVGALVAVVGLAKVESPAIEDAVESLGAPQSAVGVVIAMLVLAPETAAAVRNARRGRVQTSLNLALGSAMASIGLTIPTLAVATIWLDGPLVLGLGPTQIALLAITAAAGAFTVLPGRATLQEAGVHLVIATAFVFLAINP